MMRNSGLTFGDYAARWVARVAAHKKPRTAETYRLNLRDHLLPAFGDRPLDAITRAEVRDFLLRKLEAGYGTQTVRLMLATLRRCLNVARFEDEAIATNPADRLGHLVPRRKGPRPDLAMPAGTRRRFLAAARKEHARLAVMFTVAAYTGLRLGELLGLQWPDVDLADRVLYVRRALDWRQIASEPKGGQGRVPLNARAYEALARLRDGQENGSLWVFHGPSGRPWSRVYVWKVFARACETAGLPHASIHHLRHSFVTQLAERGVNTLQIRDLARHASVVTTELYVHMHRLHRRAVERLR